MLHEGERGDEADKPEHDEERVADHGHVPEVERRLRVRAQGTRAINPRESVSDTRATWTADQTKKGKT